MEISVTPNGKIKVTFEPEEAASVRDDLGRMWSNQVSESGDRLHSLLESVTNPYPW